MFGPVSKAVKKGIHYPALNRSGFRQYIFSFNENSAIIPDKTEIYMDMTKPMTCYYINSSHNTYLEGHQLYGKSTCDMYKRVLLLGCRCVELDCWDGPNGQPKVTHGKTLCNDIKFVDVIETINEYAFVTSPYPVVLSFEMHCSLEQQEKIATILVDVLKSRIYMAKTGMQLYPSPEELQHKFIIKGKKPPMGSDEIALAYQKAGPEGSKAPRKKEHKVKVSKNLTPLIGMDGCKFSMTEDRTPMSISSVNSKKLKKLAKEHKPVNLINYHKFHFTRIYPHAL